MKWYEYIPHVITAASIIVQLTPSKRDDRYVTKARSIWNKIAQVLEVLALNKRR